ncbi:hypothetical protein [Allochromatium vinosum]|uniref:hypothetical protein n=1 Tax=Allochromatium vinosum TaxID=1049 RepID=UPI0030B84ECD
MSQAHVDAPPGSVLTRLFPLWALLAGFVGFMVPETLSDWRAAVMPLLGVVMFGMGATLRPNDFLAIARRPALIGLGLVAAVMLHNGLGLMLGYWGARAFGQDVVRARTLAIEVGMQHSGLAAALALKSFPAAAALPGALFSVWHNLSGAMLAAWWSRRAPTTVQSPARP